MDTTIFVKKMCLHLSLQAFPLVTFKSKTDKSTVSNIG